MPKFHTVFEKIAKKIDIFPPNFFELQEFPHLLNFTTSVLVRTVDGEIFEQNRIHNFKKS